MPEQITNYPDGTIREQNTIVDGQLDGESISYDESGKVLRRAAFKAGKLHGEATSYDSTGRVTQKAFFVDGQLNGPTSIFGSDGWIVEKMMYRDGKPNGESLTYRNGAVQTRSNYVDGLLEGEFISYDERSEEHTSELQSHSDLVCRLLLE